jgi:hypothetical protein
MVPKARAVAKHASMHIDARLPEGHVLICSAGRSEHSFLVQRLGLSVECPHCGQTGVSVQLVTDFYERGLDALALDLQIR